MSDRPTYCCGACPPVEPNPNHPDCEACRTGYDCTCRDNPRCPNYQEPTMTDHRLTAERALKEITAALDTLAATITAALDDLAAAQMERDLADARAKANRLTTERDEKPVQKAAESTAETPTPADVQPGEAWIVESGGQTVTACRLHPTSSRPWIVPRHTFGGLPFRWVADSDITLVSRLVPAPRVITNPDELDRLAIGTIIRTREDLAMQKKDGDTARWYYADSGRGWEVAQMLDDLPATVLWEPGA